MSDKTSKKLRLCLVGCGRISEKHFHAIRDHPELELVAVCDLDEAKARKAAEEQGCQHFTNYIQMLDKVTPDAVVICTPNWLHPSMTIEAAEHKINVITEKPMALSMKEAREMVEACKKNGIELFVIKQNRYNPPIVKLKEAIDKGRFGKLYLGTVIVRWQRPQEYYDQDEWHGKLRKDGGALLNQASHHIDMLRWLLGPVDTVMGIAKRLGRDIETEDTGAALVKFKSGALGIIEATTLTFPKNLEGSITIQGENGTVKVGGTALNKMEIWNFKDWDNDDENVKNIGTNPPTVYGFGHTGVYRNVVHCLLDNKECEVNGEEGLHTLELIMAIYKSAMTGKEVKLPLKGDESVYDNKF
ncbi:MAG: Gfo/Idh/MocA family oxidoreductase [Nanoarchaeota archaeon]